MHDDDLGLRMELAQRIADGILPSPSPLYNFRCFGDMEFVDKGFHVLPARRRDNNYYFIDGSAHLKPFQRMNDNRFSIERKELFADRRSHSFSGSGSRNDNTSKHHIHFLAAGIAHRPKYPP